MATLSIQLPALWPRMRDVIRSFHLVAVVAIVGTLSVHACTVHAAIDQGRVFGEIKVNNCFLDRVEVSMAPKPGQVQVYNHRYPRQAGSGLITCIKVIDKWGNGTNGAWSIDDGGLANVYIHLSIRSKAGYGLGYVIEVWGRKL